MLEKKQPIYLWQAGLAADLLVTPVLTVRVTVTHPAQGHAGP